MSAPETPASPPAAPPEHGPDRALGTTGEPPAEGVRRPPESPAPLSAASLAGLGLSVGLPRWGAALVSLGVGAVFLLFLVEVYRGLGQVLTVLFAAWLVAYLFDPLIDRFEARGWDRSNAIILCLSIVVALGSVLLLLVVPYVIEEGAALKGQGPDYRAAIHRHAMAIEQWVEVKTNGQVDLRLSNLAQRVPELLEELDAEALDPVRELGKKLVGSTFGILGALARWSLFPLFVFFLLRDFDRVRLFVFDLVPPRMRPAVATHAQLIDERIARFVRGQLLVCLALAVLYSLGLVLFTDIDMAVLVGVTSGVLFAIPYFGTFFGIAVGSVLAFLKFGFSFEIIKVWLVFGGVQALEGAVLTPKIVGDSVGLHPLVVMLALVVGGNLFDLLGILLAVPVAAALQVLLGSLVELYRQSPWYRAGSDELAP